ncbi:MAG: ArsR family transcriptional regulator [Betaproteobacteria bacterium]|nr:ArsR family transcriptional regulator [Betaproteobacteria bacterium]
MSTVSRPHAKKDLGTALFGKGRRNVLAALFLTPGEPMYLREIIAAVGMGSGHVQRELENLTDAGLILREERARQVYYRPDPKAPVFDELRAMVFKTFGVADALHNALIPIATKIRLAFIYGSVAREEDTARSDIDVILVGRLSLIDAAKPLARAEALLKRRISTTIYSRAEFASRVRSHQHFIGRVLEGPKIFLIGDENVLGKLAKPESPKS